MDTEKEVNFPLRPTLLVIAAGREYEARSLGEQTARALTGDMHRLTARFSRQAWNIPVIDANDPDILKLAWAGFEEQNMAVISGYTGTEGQVEALIKLAGAVNPVATLVGIGRSLQLDDTAFGPFQKSLSILPAGLQEQFDVTKAAIKECRHENTWGNYDDFKSDTLITSGTKKYLS